jgi:opacity protein-like surface antigen
MKKLALIASSLLLAGTTSAVFAHDHVGPYIQGELGYVGQVGVPNLDGYSKSQKHLGGRIALGYLTCLTDNSNWGGEFGYGFYGHTQWRGLLNGLKVRHRSYAYDFQLVGLYKTSEDTSVFLKGGLAYMSEAVQGINDLFPGTNDETVRAFRPMLSIGASYNLIDNVDVTFTYARIFGRGITTQTKSGFEDVPSINSILLGLKYTFTS